MAGHLDPQCSAFQTAIAVLGRPWNALILGVLQAAPLRFGELSRLCRGVGPKILSARLKELEARGLLRRTVEAGPPVRVTYALSAQGRAFDEVARAIECWGRELVAPEARRGVRPSSGSAAARRRVRRTA